MSRSLALSILCAALGMSGCALNHGRAEDMPSPPCTPADCYAVAPAGCLDIDDSYMPETCTTECIPGYAQLEDGRGFCPTPGPSCPVVVTEFGFSGSVREGPARIAFIDREAGRAVLSEAGDPEIVFTAPPSSFDGFSRGEPVTLAIENVGGVTLQRVIGAARSITAVRAWSGLPDGGLEIGHLLFRTGGTTCRAPSSPPECGSDSSYRLNVTGDEGDVALEPGESLGFPTRSPEGLVSIVTHGSAVEFGAEACEVFVPWNVSFVVSDHYAIIVDG